MAADIVQNQLTRKPDSVLGLATGETPVQMYHELVRRHRAKRLDLTRITSFNLDEYAGLPPEHPGSYTYYMRERFFDAIPLPSGRGHMPDGLAADPEAAAREYERRIQTAGGIDLQILGIGTNGHIGFNEPGSTLDSRTRLVELTAETIARNSQLFPEGETAPGQAVTVGIGTILEARQIVLLACGPAKARAIRETVEGPVCATCPGSALQTHANCIVLLDDAAAAELQLPPAQSQSA